MEASELPIPAEEYPFIAFGITWLFDHVIKLRNLGENDIPRCILLNETPSMAGGEYDLVYWWHKAIRHFPGLENRARIKMLQLSRETKRFDTAELGKHLQIPTASSLVPGERWKFSASRIGIDRRTRQAIGHFATCIDEFGWLTWGCILVMEWGDDGVISLRTVRHTFGPAK